MTTIPLTFWCYYLTQIGKWRGADYDTRNFVCGLKQEPFKGELRLTVEKKNAVYNTGNVETFVQWVLPQVGAAFHDDVAGPVSFVPIPNSNVAVGSGVTGRTEELARMVAAGYGRGSEVVPAIVWDAPRAKAHKTKEYRHPGLYLPHMHFVTKPNHPVVLFDDVLTSGSQMIAAARLLRSNGLQVAHGLTLARAVADQREGAFFTKHTDTLEIDPPVFNLDDVLG